MLQGRGPGERLAAGVRAAPHSLLSLVSLQECLKLTSAFTHHSFLLFFSVSPLHTRCWLGLKMPPLSIFSFAEEPLMEPCLTLQRGVFNQCNCPTSSICVCVCLPLEPEGRLLMVAVMAMVEMVVVVMMTMQWQWRCSRDFWLSSPCLLKDSLR